MYIQSFKSKGQHVFGNYQINMDKNGSKISSSVANAMAESEIVYGKDSKKKNHYTYVIGDNGTGKTSLMKSLVIGMLSQYTQHNWTEVRFGGLPYMQYFHQPFTTWGNYEIARIGGCEAITCFENQRFLLPNKNIDNRYYEYNIGYNGMKPPVLYTLLLHNNSLPKLNKLLRGDDEVRWRVDIEYLPQPHYEYVGFGDQWVEVDPTLKPKLSLLLKMVETELNADTPPQGDDYQGFSSGLLNNRYFPRIAMTNDKYRKKVFELIYRSSIFQNLLEVAPLLLTKKEDSNKRIYDGRTHSAYKIDKDVLQTLREHDLWILPLLEDLGVVRYDIYVNDIRLDELSSGEQIMIQLFCDLSPMCVLHPEKKDFLILYDEPETSLHPKWQQKFPELFRHVVEDLYGITDSHFILCTHSPMIVMQAPQDENTSVIRFSHEDKVFKSEKVRNINRFYVEQVLLDDFGLNYYKKEEIEAMDRSIQQMSQPDAIYHTQELKDKIDELYAQIREE